MTADQLQARGYAPAYRRGEVNRCPACGQSQWLVGRVTAECAICETALPFAGPDTRKPTR